MVDLIHVPLPAAAGCRPWRNQPLRIRVKLGRWESSRIRVAVGRPSRISSASYWDKAWCCGNPQMIKIHI